MVDLNFQQVTPDAPDQREGHMMEAVGNEQETKTPKSGNQQGGMRTFRNFAGAVCWYAPCLSVYMAGLVSTQRLHCAGLGEMKLTLAANCSLCMHPCA